MWRHNKKYKGKVFISRYGKEAATGDRVFVLVNSNTNNIVKSFESWQAAVKDGWIKIK